MTSGAHESTRDATSGDPIVVRVLVLWETGSATYLLRPGEPAHFGRHRDCEVVINLPTVSRRHARLFGKSDGRSIITTVEDIGGMNGVRVRGLKIAPNTQVPVGAGDLIELGGAMLVLHPPQSLRAPSVGALAHAPAPVRAREDPMKVVERLIDVVAQSELAVLLVGEPGVGKTFTAEAIHARSYRAPGRLVRLNCASVPESLLERELFGWQRGSAGLADAKPGLVEWASGGTLLVEDVDAMPLATQAKLVRALETREVTRLGSQERRAIDVRIIASTSQDLLARSVEGVFRRDLYYRLNGVRIVIPALRERKGEISRFASIFLDEAASKARRAAPRLSNEALGLLIHHPFPANIRELKSTMGRAFVLARGGYVGPEHVFFDTPHAGLGGEAGRSSADAITRRFRPVAPTEPPAAPTEEITVPVIVPTAPRRPASPDAPPTSSSEQQGRPRPRKR